MVRYKILNQSVTYYTYYIQHEMDITHMVEVDIFQEGKQ